MDLTIIAAVSENNVIGIENKIPWNIKEDMKRFRELTTNHPVIMGRKTFESIPEKFRPLPNRKNIILSKEYAFQNGIYVARNKNEALGLTEGNSSYVMGGGEIYNLFLSSANKLELTKIHQSFKGDAFFPKINWNDWNLVNEIKNQTDTGLNYSFLTYERA